MNQLLEFASITSRCNSTSPRKEETCIKAAANQAAELGTVEDTSEFLTVLSYLATTNCGIEIFGVLISYKLVCDIGMGIATKLPF